jgi:malonyl-CoA decarboxylase
MATRVPDRPAAAAEPRPQGGFLQSLMVRWRDFPFARAVRFGASGPPTDLGPEDAERLVQRMRECLEARGGEASARARAIELGRLYLGLSRDGRLTFLTLLATRFGADRAATDAAARALLDAGDGPDRAAAARTLRAALTPPRVRLLTQFNALPQGTKFLVDMRGDMLDLAGGGTDLAELEDDLRGLLASWFDVGFLDLQRLTWDSPASLLEKVARYEAVHAVRGWDDLKNRLDSDRRLYAFFHPRMPDEPLIFVEVALVSGMSADIATLLDETAPRGDPAAADTAVFYSISNAQKGLAGISFGGFLIKRVVDLLQAEFPRLKTFATLSPIPGFRRWLEGEIARGAPRLLTAADRKALAAVTGGSGGKGALKAVLADDGWIFEEALAAALEAPLTRLCARYLLEAKRPDGRARDPVAHFHLSNGARVERINWLADPSPNGLARSLGLMVNYRYRLDEIEENHEAYASGRPVRAAPPVRSLAG